jgi:hypothetical protein
MRRMVAVITAAGVIGIGITLASPGAAYAATASCTGSSPFLTTENAPAWIPTIGTNVNQPNCDLGYGNQGAAVSQLQQQMNVCYGTKLATDGVFGSLTQAAVKHVQSLIGVTVDGIYGPQTRNAMKWFDSARCLKLRQPLTYWQ